MSFWPNRGEPDPRPPLGAAYRPVEPVAPRSPAVRPRPGRAAAVPALNHRGRCRRRSLTGFLWSAHRGFTTPATWRRDRSPMQRRHGAARRSADVVYVLCLMQAAFVLLAGLGEMLLMGGNPLYLLLPVAKMVVLFVFAAKVVSGRRWAMIGVIVVQAITLVGLLAAGRRRAAAVARLHAQPGRADHQRRPAGRGDLPVRSMLARRRPCRRPFRSRRRMARRPSWRTACPRRRIPTHRRRW